MAVLLLVAFHVVMARASFSYDSCIRGYHEYKAYGMRQWEKFCTAIVKQIILMMTKRLQLFVVELPLATCQGMCHSNMAVRF